MTLAKNHAMATRLLAAGQSHEALQLLSDALAESESADLWSDWATVSHALGHHDEAETGFHLALQLDPRSAQIAFNLGVLLHQTGRHAESVPFLEQGLQISNSTERAVARQLLLQTPSPVSSTSNDPVHLEDYLRKFLSADPNERSYFETHIHRYVATLQQLPDGQSTLRLLELGAAFHHLTPAIKHCKHYAEVRCSDIWPGDARESRTLSSNDGSESFQVVVDNFDLQLHPWPYEDASFGVVLCCEILEHLHTDPLGLFAEINRILKPGGTLLLSTPNLASAHAVEETLRGGSPYGYGKFEIGGNPTDRHNREYTVGEVERLAIAAGFAVTSLRTRDFYWPGKREIFRLLASQAQSIARRGDCTFLLAEKRTAVIDRYPSEFYAGTGVQSNRRSHQSPRLSANSPVPVALSQPARNILVVHEILPHFDCSGADLRLFELVRELRGQGHNVTFLARDGRDELQYRPPLEALGAIVFSNDPERLRHCGDAGTTPWSLREVLQQGRFDIAILSHWFWSGISVPEHYMDEIRLWSPQTRILVLSEDRHGERERRSAQLSGLLSDFERGEEFEQREKEIYQRADLLLYVTETDARHFLTLLPDLQTEHLPTIAEAGSPGGGFSSREGVLFLGNFENLANRDALRWLLDEIWPLVRKKEPGIKLYIAGNAATPDLVPKLSGVTVLGKLGDLAPAFAARRLFIGPIRYGTGIITKNMIALAHGLPVVTTGVGAEGLQLVHREHALIADSASDFTASILQLYRDEALWNSLSVSGRAYIRSKFSLQNLQSQIRKIVDRAMQLHPRHADPNHIWSYRAVEETNPEVLSAPANYRRMLRTFAYWQMGRRHLTAGRHAEAIEQFRHIFVAVQSPLLATVFHSTLLNDMAHCYRELGNQAFAERCERELRKPARPWTAPVPPEPRAPSIKTSAPKTPEISVIIPTYNRSDVLRLCLSALAYQSLPADRWEVIVVDDGSTDETEALCRSTLLPFSSLRYMHQENQGAGAARRTGVEMARSEFLLLINDDTIPGSNLLVEHLSVHRKHPSEKWAVLGEFRPSQESIRRALSLFVNTSAFFFPQQNLKAGQLCDQAYFVTCNLSVRRDAVLEAGSFDPQFRVAEDTDLGTRLAQRGFKVRFHPDAGAVHEHGRFSLNDLIHRAQSYGAADWKLFQKHPQLLGDGSGPFGRLRTDDFSRIQGYLDSHRHAVDGALAALEALEDVDMIPLCQKDAQGNTKAEAIMAQLAQIVPIVYWYYLFETFLLSSKQTRSQNTHSPQFAEAASPTR